MASPARASTPVVIKAAGCSVNIGHDIYNARLTTSRPVYLRGASATIAIRNSPSWLVSIDARTRTSLRDYAGRVRQDFGDNRTSSTGLLIRHGDYLQAVATWNEHAFGVPVATRSCTIRVVIR